ncbi:pyridoxamine 5'-phosphate oxidase family protein [Nocardia otitidiscaviarum]|uniref:pyridoxamine 5'-phosphate oxidase family protein n=1 Tax=Nocardia otitidiscaviarum TaxID=1823 RepID=UPI0018930389|nr:pyridoxamine 5'-phosphate oxidase family protein [Nocardia otitidiscaviarum]MBF6240825.1 pyridoxamine 5'-phosphate oxidase family protein [Nocardia otitidiscaviarum]
MTTSYHPGEVAVQQRMGQSDIAQHVGRMIRAEIPHTAAAFLAEQPLVVIAAADDAGRLWASQLIGPAGFARATDERTIVVDALPTAADPLTEPLRSTRHIGMIALQPQRRRRMRVNGVTEPTERGLRITTDQVYSNCPKYITRRTIDDWSGASAVTAHRSSELTGAQQRAITAADTFFIASADPDGNADASHRGGNPGFLQVLSPTRLRWPDYRGNSMFMTLGNIAADPRCGLLIPDWRTGSTLQLTGTAEIIWDDTTFAPGSQATVDFTVTEVVEIAGASPLRWGASELSPVNP